MTSVVQVCNMALGRLGIHQSISSLSDQSQLAQTCNQFLDQARRALLAEFDWPFAKVFAPLSLTTNTAPPPWTLEYRRPPCLKVRSIGIVPAAPTGADTILSGTASSIDFGGGFNGVGGPAYQGGAQPYTPGDPSPTIIPFDTGSAIQPASQVAGITTPPGQPVAVIWCNVNNAAAWLTVDVTDPGVWEPGFVTAFSWHLAVEMATSLTGSAAVMEAMAQGKQAAMEKAMATEGNEGSMVASWNAEWVDARDYGYAGWGYGQGGYGDGL